MSRLGTLGTIPLKGDVPVPKLGRHSDESRQVKVTKVMADMSEIDAVAADEEAAPGILTSAEAEGSSKQLANTERPKPPRAGLGRPPGSPNRATAAAREAFQLFVEGNLEQIQDLFDRVAKDDPKGALELLLKLSEFVLPRLTRTSIDGELAVRPGMPAPNFDEIPPAMAASAYLEWIKNS